MKVLHCSDIHLGKRPFGNENFSQKRYEDYFNAFSQVVELGILERVQVLIISGDLFDRRDLTPDILARSEEFFKKLKRESIKVFITEGNHDNSNRYDSINSWLHYLEERDLAKRLSYIKKGQNEYEFQKERVEDVNFYGLGFPGFGVDSVVENLSEKLDENEKNIVMIHTAVGGEKTALPGLVKTSAMNLLRDKVIYVAGGHLHSKVLYPSETRGEKPFFFIPGSTEYWNVISERSDEKGVFIFDTESREYRYINIKPRKRIKESYILGNGKDDREEFKNWAEKLKLTGEELVVVEILIEENNYVDTREKEKILEECGALKGYVIPVFKNSEKNEDREFSGGNYTTSEIENSLISQWEGFSNSKLIDSFELLKNYQRDNGSGDSENFFQVFDEILEGMIADEDK